MAYVQASPQADEIFSKLEALNQMREALAATLDHSSVPITEQSFKAVCMPVGKELKRWGEEKGLQVKQISHKNRNPLHGLQDFDFDVYAQFQADPQLKQMQAMRKEKDLQGSAFYYRIPVVKSCLHCHGDKKQRPQFIKVKYPNDKAFGFKEKELRGLYWVFKRETKQ